jgi:hypothetical protein
VAEAPQKLFRRDAFERYRESQERAVLPRNVRPNTLRLLWAVAVLLGCGVGAFWSQSVPQYASGVGMRAVKRADGSAAAQWVALIPSAAGVRNGQPVFASIEGRGEVRTSVASILDRNLSAAEVQTRWMLLAGEAPALPNSVDVALLTRAPFSGERHRIPLRIQVGKVSLLSMLLSSRLQPLAEGR